LPGEWGTLKIVLTRQNTDTELGVAIKNGVDEKACPKREKVFLLTTKVHD